MNSTSFNKLVSSLVAALRHARAGNPLGAEVNLNNAIVFACRAQRQTVVSELVEHSVGKATREKVEWLVAYVSQPVMGDLRDAVDDAIRREGMEPLSTDVDLLLDRANAA